jgi:hypothetical protein
MPGHFWPRGDTAQLPLILRTHIFGFLELSLNNGDIILNGEDSSGTGGERKQQDRMQRARRACSSGTQDQL